MKSPKFYSPILLIAFGLWFTFILLLITTSKAEAQWSAGNGTPTSPYQIHTQQQLQLLADSTNNGDDWSNNKHFILMNNITTPVTTSIGTTEGTGTTWFKGHFNGQGHTITLNINRPSLDNQGLFGVIWGATISNVVVDGVVNGDTHIGGIVGGAWNNSIIDRCINLANISGNTLVGGIVGQTTNRTSVTNCINIGKVSSGNLGSAGGITGGLYYSSSLTNCINSGFIRGNNSGGIVGIYSLQTMTIGYTTVPTITNMKNVGVVEGNYSFGCIVGQIIYFGSNPTSITNCWWDKQMCPWE